VAQIRTTHKDPEVAAGLAAIAKLDEQLWEASLKVGLLLRCSPEWLRLHGDSMTQSSQQSFHIACPISKHAITESVFAVVRRRPWCQLVR
jgi:hypothetical protein